MEGAETNNAAAPVAAAALEVLPAIANAASPTWTEGFNVLESVDLTGRQRVRGTLTLNNAAPDADLLGVMPAVANALGPLWTEGDQVLESVDLHGGQRMMNSNIPESTAAWTSATGGNTAVTMTVLGYTSVVVTLNQGTTITGGVVTFEVSDTTAFTNAYAISGIQQGTNSAGVSYTLIANTNAAFLFDVAGWAAFRVRLSTVITGTGTVNVGVAASGGVQGLAVLNTPQVGTTQNIRSSVNLSALGDNQVNENFFADNGGNKNPLAVGNWVYGGAFSGAADAARQGWSKMRTPTVFRTLSATASGNTTIWTPGTGNKFRLLKLFIQVTDNASLTSGGILVIDIQDATTSTNITFSVFVPTTAVTTVIGDGAEIQLDLGQFGILSAAANNTLNVNLSVALITGACRIIAMGTEE
jgi:hypothetical protein